MIRLFRRKQNREQNREQSAEQNREQSAEQNREQSAEQDRKQSAEQNRKHVPSPAHLICIAIIDSGGGAPNASEYYWHYSELLIDPENGQLYVMGSKDRYRVPAEGSLEDGFQVYMPLHWDRYQKVLEECESVDPVYRDMNSENWRTFIKPRP